MLILQNDGDTAVPWYQGIEFFLALRRLGKEVYLFNYNGQPHGLQDRADQKDYTIRLQQYFDHFLKGAPAPDWMTEGRAVPGAGSYGAFGVERRPAIGLGFRLARRSLPRLPPRRPQHGTAAPQAPRASPAPARLGSEDTGF